MNRTWLLLQCAIILLVFAPALGQQIPTCNNCCQEASHTKLDNSRRSIQSIWKPGQSALCDNSLVSGWHRFTSFVGGKMPTTKVNVNHCGTQFPIWLDGTTGTHPTSPTDPVVNIKACVNIRGLRRGCFRSFQVGVKRCPGNFFVYYLQKLTRCFAAYCAGDGQPCPYGQTGSSLKKCSAGPQKFPTLYLGYPVISPKDETKEEVSLLCIVPIHEKIRQWKNVTYEIEWYVDGKKKKEKEKPFCKPGQGKTENSNPCPGDKQILSLLPGSITHEYYEPGQWITCEVKARYTTDPLHPWSDTVTILHPFFAGIMVTPSALVITECQDPFFQEITLTPKIPVRNTFLTVTFYLPEGLWLESKGDCSIQLQGTKSVTVRVGATCTTLYGLRKLSVITPQITNDEDSDFWGYFGLPTVWVTVLQKDQKLHKCTSITDPHIRMLDEQNAQGRWHDFFGNAEYLLYHNKERHFEVQTKQWGCNSRAVTCNCGVIIRDHNDLISFSCCGDPPRLIRDATTPIRIDIPRKKCLAPGITIRESMNGKNTVYEVITPTGIKVRLERNYWGIDVTIYAPKTKNSGDVAGLCTYKGQDRDITALEPTYRKSPSYFEKLPEEINKGARAFRRSCACNKEKDKDLLKNDCTADGIKVDWHTDQTKHFNRIKMCDNNPEKSRKKRDVEGSDELTNEDYEFFMTPSESNAHDRVKRSLVSKENATRYCAERLTETPVGKLCAKLGTNVQALVNVCSADIEYTGDHSFAIGAVAMLMNECNDVIIENITVNTNETSNVTKPTMPPIMEEVAQLLCPNDCTFNGKCVNGSCVCNKDYTANDCSISIYQKPRIARIQGNGLCDRRKRPCKKATIQGVDFLNSRNLTCHIKEIEIVNSSWIPNKYETKYQGIMTDLVLVECLLPDTPVRRMRYDETAEGIPAAGLMISVSNNGIDKSDQQLKMISFDSVCMDCNVSTGCFLKKNTCFINRYCFAPNEPNPRDWCQQCIPEVNTNTWTKRQVNLPPNVTSQTNYYVVYGENFKLPIEAIDPEGMPVTISLMKGSPKEAFIRKNVLYWNVTTNHTTHFSFNATDACRASATLNITVTVNVCPCNNRGRCIPQDPRGQGIYACLCSPGYTGQYCNTEIDECASYPCLRGRCIDLLNNYSCSCDLGFEGRNCDVDIDYCISSPCVYGNCTDEVSGYSCNCLPGYSGLECDVDIDECSSSPCLNNGSCSDQVNGFKCHCLAGYVGHNCSVNINECQSSPCVNKGTCMDKINGFTCHCPPGFSGSRCEENVNECVQVSCGNGNCVDGVNNYSCVCNVGYTGRHCDVIITKCSNDSCYPGVSCNESTTPISCGLCPPGFTGNGKTCKDIDDCLNHTCANNASCVDGINGYICNCTAGYTGSHCKTDIDDCVNHTCANGASCVDGINDYSCSCVVGYTGGQCDKDIDECYSSPCDNGGSCIDGVNNFSCNCSTGFTGKRCETNIDDCFNVTCKNGGSCEDGISNFTCSCQAGYTGVLCETDIDDCVNHTCANYGSCVDGVSDFSCICMEGYTGVWCEKDVPTLSPTPPDRSSPKKMSSKTTGPTTQAGVDDNRKTDFTLQIRVLKAWDSSLQDKNSEKFKELANIMKKEIWRTYSGRSELKEVEIISMRPGSIIAEFRLTFKTKVTSEDALTPLKREVATGKLGRLQIDPDSLKEKEALQDFHKKDEAGNNLPLIVGLSCGAFVLVVMFAITVCYRKRSVPFAAHSGIGPEMPPDEPCSRREKYEMAPTISKEPEHQEQEGIFNEGMEK